MQTSQNPNQNPMQNQNLQPLPQLTALLAELTGEMLQYAANRDYQYNLPNYQVCETGDNSGCLNFAITFNDCDAPIQALQLAKNLILEHAYYLAKKQDLDLAHTKINEIPTHIAICNMLDSTPYYIATLTRTDCTLYINCIYNQQ